MKEVVVNASDVKPDFKLVKKVWSSLLNNYFDSNGEFGF